jgi:hypothetical protein
MFETMTGKGVFLKPVRKYKVVKSCDGEGPYYGHGKSWYKGKVSKTDVLSTENKVFDVKIGDVREASITYHGFHVFNTKKAANAYVETLGKCRYEHMTVIEMLVWGKYLRFKDGVAAEFAVSLETRSTKKDDSRRS